MDPEDILVKTFAKMAEHQTFDQVYLQDAYCQSFRAAKNK
jgi:hypothetical protein